MQIKKLWDKLINGNGDAKETEFLPAILEVTETPPSPVGRLVMWTILVLLVVGVIYSMVGTIDEVAVANGKVVPAGQVKTIQTKDKGIIKNIYVKEGDYVKKGDILVELDPTSTGADLDSLKKRAAYFKLDIDRLNAELNGTPFNPVPSPDLEPKDIMAQISLYQSRTNQYHAELNAAQMLISQKTSAIQAETASYEKYDGIQAIAAEKERRLQTLVQDNAVAEFQLLEQTSQRIEYSKAAESQANIVVRAQAELAEAQQRLANVDAAYKKDVMTALVEARKNAYSFEEEIKKAEENNRLSTIVAPVDGRIYNLAVHTVGGIVTDAQSLMMIVPDDVQMELEVWADNKDIGFIKTDQVAEIKVDTFNFQKFGVVEAIVTEISPDAYSDPKDPLRDKKFRLALSIKQDRMQAVGDGVQVSPGMNVIAEIKIKKKKIIDFFLDPFKQYKSESLRER